MRNRYLGSLLAGFGSLTIEFFLYLSLVSIVCHQRAVSAEPLRDLESHSPFHPPQSLEAWQERAKQLSTQLKVSLGLFPALELDPVVPEIYGQIDREDYTIERVTFDSLPGLKVTGNLYRPKQLKPGQKAPGVLCPHGHWEEARFYAASPRQIKQLLATGAERFEAAAENHIQARCVQLARMGCVVFHWDMLGYCDSTQISFDRAHRFARQAAETEVTSEGWLMYSPLAESHCQSVPGLQALATQRAVDFLLSLPDVDPGRIAITGASGGGTQTFLGAALDDRIQVAFPAVMVSTGMQGGCTCENACWLRTGTGNVEIAGLIAPRPLGMTAADDWTRTMPNDGYPELQSLYRLWNASDHVGLFPALHFEHNFNHVSRVSLYGWINKFFHLGYCEPILERDFDIARRDELSVWDAQHPAPEAGLEFERQLMKLWADLADSRLTSLLQGDQEQIAELISTLEKGWQVCLGLTAKQLVSADCTLVDGQITQLDSPSDGRWKLTQALVSQQSPIVIEIEGEGSRQTYYFDELGMGEQSLVANPRLAAAYTFGYNLPEFAIQARKLGLTLDALARRFPGKAPMVRANGPSSALAAAGLFCAQQLNPKLGNVELAIDPGDFRFSQVSSIRAPYFLPGSARFWDLPGLVAVLHNTKISMPGSNGLFDSRFARLLEIRGLRLVSQD
ncbi:MAG: acetylxylan esterase [Planctomycetales bacterium]|nr:acetylxylan esterase [Planctomycetales bacterium]